jgi:hypothetical protein
MCCIRTIANKKLQEQSNPVSASIRCGRCWEHPIFITLVSSAVLIVAVLAIAIFVWPELTPWHRGTNLSVQGWGPAPDPVRVAAPIGAGV